MNGCGSCSGGIGSLYRCRRSRRCTRRCDCRAGCHSRLQGTLCRGLRFAIGFCHGRCRCLRGSIRFRLCWCFPCYFLLPHCFNDLLQNGVVQKDLLIIVGFINRFKRIIRNGIIIHRQEWTFSLGDRRIAAVPVRAHKKGIPVITCVIPALVIMDGLDDDALILTGIGSLVGGFSGFVQQTDLHCSVKDIQRRDVIAVLVLLDTDAEAGAPDSHSSLRRTHLVGGSCG